MFSIVIPLFNKKSTIERTIKSVLNQTFQNFEIIIVNDGSTDESLNILNSIADQRIHIYTKQNEGVSIARNFGINKASFDFIAFLDADDVWLPDYLDSIKFLIEKYPQCSMYATGRFNDNYGIRTSIISKINSKTDFIIDDYCREPFIMDSSSTCIRKEVVDKVGYYPPHIKIGEDIDFRLRIACHFKIAYLNVPKYIYYLFAENNASSCNLKWRDIIPAWKWYFYPYKNKLSLYSYATKQMIRNFLLLFPIFQKIIKI